MDDIQEIKADVKVLLQSSAVHNALLAEHKNFSIALQNEQKIIKTELAPIKSHVHLMNVILKVLGVLSTGLLLQVLIHQLWK